MRAAIYARVSTNNGQDPHMQTRELREYCQRRGIEITGRVRGHWGFGRERAQAATRCSSSRMPQEVRGCCRGLSL
jgi:DNA invertase Pin-like site-specific DNA recombinase